MRNFIEYVEYKFPDIRLTPKVHFAKFENLSSKNTIQHHNIVRKIQQPQQTKPTEQLVSQTANTSTSNRGETMCNKLHKFDKQRQIITPVRKSAKRQQKANI
jgi:hypothetical protein